MPLGHDVAGLAALAFVLATTGARLVTSYPRRAVGSRVRYAAVFFVLLVALFVPFDGLVLAAQIRAVLGDPSIPTIVVAALSSARVRSRRSRSMLALLAVGGAAMLYPFALGATAFDPYRLGYGAPAFVGAVLAIALAATLTRLHLVGACLALGVLAWAMRLYASPNLIDYLLDPLLVLWGIRGIAPAH